MPVQVYSNSQKVRLTDNFTLDEFKCKCGKCSTTLLNSDLVLLLQRVRDYFKQPIKVTSGYRCVNHNANVGGVKKSQHLKGNAADIQVLFTEPKQVQEFLIATQKLGIKVSIGRYDTFTHVDVRDDSIIFDRRSKK